MNPEVELDLPFAGRWLVQNSPARRVPSHGTDLLATRYAIDFVGVDERHRTASVVDAGTILGTEPPERFVAFGRAVLAPANGVVVAVHDGEPDHEARRSPLSLLPYALSQARRLRGGERAVAGNQVVLALPDGGAHVALVHLRRGSLTVRVGERVATGQRLAECGNSGNSTQPHVHVQAMDGSDAATARALPIRFRRYREWLRGRGSPVGRHSGVPGERSVVEPV